MADLSDYLKVADTSSDTISITEWNLAIQAIEDAINTSLTDAIDPIFQLTDGATVAVDWTKGSVQRVVVGGNRTFTFSGAKSGQRCTLVLKQNGTGGFTSQTFPASMRFTGGSATQPTTTANKSTVYEMIYNDADLKYDVLTVSLNH